nr:MAG TPA: hypothetical protein [Microviridae sp.]
MLAMQMLGLSRNKGLFSYQSIVFLYSEST